LLIARFTSSRPTALRKGKPRLAASSASQPTIVSMFSSHQSFPIAFMCIARELHLQLPLACRPIVDKSFLRLVPAVPAGLGSLQTLYTGIFLLFAFAPHVLQKNSSFLNVFSNTQSMLAFKQNTKRVNGFCCKRRGVALYFPMPNVCCVVDNHALTAAKI